MVSPLTGWPAEMVSGVAPYWLCSAANVAVSSYTEMSVFVIVAYSSLSACTVPTALPEELSRLPDRLLGTFCSTCPAEGMPPSKQWPAVSIRARSPLCDEG